MASEDIFTPTTLSTISNTSPVLSCNILGKAYVFFKIFLNTNFETISPDSLFFMLYSCCLPVKNKLFHLPFSFFSFLSPPSACWTLIHSSLKRFFYKKNFDLNWKLDLMKPNFIFRLNFLWEPKQFATGVRMWTSLLAVCKPNQSAIKFLILFC